MMNLRTAIFALAICSVSAAAQTSLPSKIPRATVLYQGVTYKDAKVDGVRGDVATLRTPGNKTGQVPVKNLPPILQRAAEARTAGARKWEAIAAERARVAANAPTIDGLIQFKAKEGLVVRQRDDRNVLLRGLPTEASMVDGDHVACQATIAGTFSFTTVLGSTSTIRSYNYTGPTTPTP